MSALRRAGFVTPSFRQVPQTWPMRHPDQLFDMVSGGTARAAATLRAQTATARETIRAALRETVRQFKDGSGYGVPMPAVLAMAMKPPRTQLSPPTGFLTNRRRST